MAGSEAAWQAANMGVPVVIHEMRPKVGTFAHQHRRPGRDGLLQLLPLGRRRTERRRPAALGNARRQRADHGDGRQAPPARRRRAGRRPRRLCASVTAGAARAPEHHRRIGEITDLPEDGHWIIATGPLTSDALGQAIAAETGAEALAFFDAIAPIVYFDSIDMAKAWMQSRYDKGETEDERTAYLNCPMDRDTYDAFIDALLAADKTEFHEGETAGYFDGCLPIEVMAERGRETLRHGPMKPVGLTNPHQPDVKAHAVVQLRRDNALGTLYNIVGFQTKMKYGAQTEVLRMIPGLENARFARLGGIHRNTFLNSPDLLDARCACAPARISALPGRSPASKAMSNPRRWACWPGASPLPRSSAAPGHRRRRTAMGALITTSPAAPRPRPSSR